MEQQSSGPPSSEVGASQPVTPRPAATVLLLRDTAEGVGVYFQERPSTMAFAPGMIVFPGGGVDRDDDKLPMRGTIEAGLRHESPKLRQHLAAALRETFEECGVLFAKTLGGQWVCPETAAKLHSDFLNGAPVRELLEREELHLCPAPLRPWSRWITPEAEPLRFDAYFFAATPPPGQAPRYRDEVSETVHAESRPAREILRNIATKKYRAMPPTRAALVELAAFDRVQDALRRPRGLMPVLGRPRRTHGA